ncbi:MAG: radical SAM protein [Thermodesulfobacteriota bacterium]
MENVLDTALPERLSRFSRILFDPGMQHKKIAERLAKRLPQAEWLEVEDGSSPGDLVSSGEKCLYLKRYKGRFLRFCPGTKFYRCCGYRILHIGENCPLNCSYCILKAYFQDNIQKVWANQEDLKEELSRELESNPDILYRMGTGEFTDSLALEPLTGYSRDLIGFVSGFSNARLELKSKVADLGWLDAVEYPEQILPAWSLNAPEVVQNEEMHVDSLEERLQAAAYCAGQGFRVCLHFDPILYYPGWEKGYARSIEMIFDYLTPEQIAYLSLGSFRGMPELKDYISRNWPHSKYIYEEYVTGRDGKMRLLRPLRVKQFDYMVGLLRRYGLDRQIYFCMESDEVWKHVLGYTPDQLGGLDRHLLKLAFAIP